MRKASIAFLVLIALCAGVIAILAKGNSNRVPVGLVWLWNLTGDTTPVETHLYEYIRSPGSEFKYETTGKRTSFRFPKTYYSYEENQAGGPQRFIGLSVDRETLRPLARVIVENEKVTNTKSIQHYLWEMDDNNRRYVSRNLGITIDTNADEVEQLLKRHVFSSLVKDGSWEYQDKLCGFEFARRRRSRAEPVEDDKNVGQGVVGLYSDDLFAVSVGGGTRNSSLKCDKRADTCQHAFHYHNVSVEYNIPKDKLCQHVALSQSVGRLLDKYRIK